MCPVIVYFSFVYVAFLKSFFCFFSYVRWFLSPEKINLNCGRNKEGSHGSISKLFPLTPPVIRDFQEYVEPGEDFPASPQRRTTGAQEDRGDSVVLPLGADTLTHNLGLPVLVVCTKVSLLSDLATNCLIFGVLAFLDVLFSFERGSRVHAQSSDSRCSCPGLWMVEPQACTTTLLKCLGSETVS